MPTYVYMLKVNQKGKSLTYVYNEKHGLENKPDSLSHFKSTYLSLIK